MVAVACRDIAVALAVACRNIVVVVTCWDIVVALAVACWDIAVVVACTVVRSLISFFIMCTHKENSCISTYRR